MKYQKLLHMRSFLVFCIFLFGFPAFSGDIESLIFELQSSDREKFEVIFVPSVAIILYKAGGYRDFSGEDIVKLEAFAKDTTVQRRYLALPAGIKAEGPAEIARIVVERLKKGKATANVNDPSLGLHDDGVFASEGVKSNGELSKVPNK